MKLQKQINNKNMTQNKTPTQISSSHECCMCGDYGFSNELFQCKVCQFRSQHRYCSNLYPNVAESQRICNWCLSQKDDTKDKSQNSSNSSSSFRNDAVSQDDSNDLRGAKIRAVIKSSRIKNHETNIKRQPEGRGGPIKKQRSMEALPSSPAARKSIVTAAAAAAAAKEAERLRRTRSEDIAKVGIAKQVFRNRVRRYKLLDEVSS